MNLSKHSQWYLQLESIKRVNKASVRLLDNKHQLANEALTYWATIPPHPPDMNCDAGISCFGSL